MVNPQLIAAIDSVWDPHTVDVFAHIDITQLPRRGSWPIVCLTLVVNVADLGGQLSVRAPLSL